MKASICTAAGLLGGLIAGALGGWDKALETLVIFMAMDWISGIICAAVFKRSPKTQTGALESRAGLKGLIRKGAMLLTVLVAYRLDLVIGSAYIRDAVIISFIANEAISITENLGLIGVPMPKVVKKAIDILNEKSEEDDNE